MEAKISKILLIRDFALMYFLIGFITIWITLIRIYTTKLNFTTTRVYGKIGIINIKELNIPLNKINDVFIHQDILGKIFNYGTIHITSSSNFFELKFVSHPKKFKNKLLDQIYSQSHFNPWTI